jgi:hypothetical protein
VVRQHRGAKPQPDHGCPYEDADKYSVELMPSLENMTSRFWDHTKREEDKSARGSPIVQAGEQEFIRTTGRIILMTILLITGRFIVFYYAFLP